MHSEGNSRRSTEIVNALSLDMNNLFDVVHESELFDNKKVLNNVMREYLPQSLQRKVGLEKILKNVPEN